MDSQSIEETKYGIVLLNMGGPESLDDVQPFLFNLFSDPDLIQIPLLLKPFQKMFAWFIAKFRTSGTKEMYKQIGNGSPILEITDTFSNLLEKELSKLNYKNKIFVAMRYTSPRASETIKQLELFDPDQIVLFSQYPHYADATTGSSIKEFKKFLGNSCLKNIEILEIDDWGLEPEYIGWWTEGIIKELEGLQVPIDKNVHVIFSAHGLPQRYVEQGEKYPERISEATAKVIENLNSFQFTYHVAYQSRAGPFPWTQPYTDELLDDVSKENPSAVIIVPLGFVTNHVETLYEIDILYKDQAKDLGIPIYKRVDVPDADNEYVKNVSKLVSRYLRSEK